MIIVIARDDLLGKEDVAAIQVLEDKIKQAEKAMKGIEAQSQVLNHWVESSFTESFRIALLDFSGRFLRIRRRRSARSRILKGRYITLYLLNYKLKGWIQKKGLVPTDRRSPDTFSISPTASISGRSTFFRGCPAALHGVLQIFQYLKD